MGDRGGDPDLGAGLGEAALVGDLVEGGDVDQGDAVERIELGPVGREQARVAVGVGEQDDRSRLATERSLGCGPLPAPAQQLGDVVLVAGLGTEQHVVDDRRVDRAGRDPRDDRRTHPECLVEGSSQRVDPDVPSEHDDVEGRCGEGH